MIYIVAGVMVLCIIIIIFGIRVLKENKKIITRKKELEDEDENFPAA